MMIRFSCIILLALILSGCATFGVRFVQKDFCELAPNIKAHRKDTLGTQRRIDVYREFYRRRCAQDYQWSTP